MTTAEYLPRICYFSLCAIVQDPCQQNGVKHSCLQNSIASGVHLKLVLFSLDIHESIHRVTNMKIITKLHYIDKFIIPSWL
jgi:hypothetical protein